MGWWWGSRRAANWVGGNGAGQWRAAWAVDFALMLPVLRALARLQLPAALIACGGIHTVAQMQQALDAGADAVQMDTAVWVEPALPNWLATAWEERGSRVYADLTQRRKRKVS